MDNLSKLKRRSERGFTLTEVMVASSISAFILAMTMDAMLDLSRQLARVSQESIANDESKLLNDYISTTMVAVGGGMLRPWTSMWVEDAWNEAGSDRVTFATLEDLSLQCPIESLHGSHMEVDDHHDGCCLTEDFQGRQVIAVTGQPDGNAHWATFEVTSVNTTACTMAVDEGVGSVLDNAPDSDTAWAEGFVSVVHMRQLWVDHDQDLLMVLEDYNHDGELDTRVVADRVIDLQAAMGYDVAPWDWRIDDSGSNDDEWLLNAEGDTFASGDGQGLELAQLEDLRMVMIGVMVGAPTRSDPDSAPKRILNGPVRQRDGWVLRSFLATTGLRNYDIMR